MNRPLLSTSIGAVLGAGLWRSRANRYSRGHDSLAQWLAPPPAHASALAESHALAFDVQTGRRLSRLSGRTAVGVHRRSVADGAVHADVPRPGTSVLRRRADPPGRARRQFTARLSRARRARIARLAVRHVGTLVRDVRRDRARPTQDSRNQLARLLRTGGADEIIHAAFEDRPALFLSSHYGNFELSAFALGLLGIPTWTVARPLDNVFLDRYVTQFRGLTGQRLLPKNGSSGQIDVILETNGILAILGDQHAGPRGCWVDFFGRPASSHKAIAPFALSSDATVVFCYTRRMGEPLQLRMGSGGWFDTRTIPPEMRTVPGIIGWYTRILENTIRQAPEQYWWVHRRWKDNRPRRGSVRTKKPRSWQATS